MNITIISGKPGKDHGVKELFATSTDTSVYVDSAMRTVTFDSDSTVALGLNKIARLMDALAMYAAEAEGPPLHYLVLNGITGFKDYSPHKLQILIDSVEVFIRELVLVYECRHKKDAEKFCDMVRTANPRLTVTLKHRV